MSPTSVTRSRRSWIKVIGWLALAAILLGVVLLLYWLYDRLVGIDNMKLG